jgi:chorismate--pyruvate lyase
VRGAKRRNGGWRTVGPNERILLPPQLAAWIGLQGSLTERLAQHLGAPIEVLRHAQGPAAVHHDERRLLSGAARAHVREISLTANRVPVVSARTVVPPASMRLLASVRGLGTRPLAALLFGAGAPRCVVREYARVAPGMAAHAAIVRSSGAAGIDCWARRSLFELAGERLLVTEIFLPPVFPCA